MDGTDEDVGGFTFRTGLLLYSPPATYIQPITSPKHLPVAEIIMRLSSPIFQKTCLDKRNVIGKRVGRRSATNRRTCEGIDS